MHQTMLHGFLITYRDNGEVLIQMPIDNKIIDVFVAKDEKQLKPAISKLRYVLKFRRELEKLGTWQLDIPDNGIITVHETKGKGSPRARKERIKIKSLPTKTSKKDN